MASPNIKEFGRACWSEVYNRIIGASVFIDDVSAECLHWDGGLLNLLSGGAVDVKPLSPFECAKAEHKKGVFICQATSTQLYTVRDIITHSDFTHCILIVSASLDVVYSELNEGRDVSDVIASGRAQTEATKQLEGMMMEWIGKKQCAVEAVHVPIFTISLTSNIFVTPPYAKVYPTFNESLVPSASSIDLYSVNNEERAKIRRLAGALNNMLGAMSLKDDVYYMGTFSSLVAGVLENSPVCVNRRKHCSTPASLILVDSSLDLCGLTSHSTQSVLDKIASVLPRFPGHETEVAVDMSPICEANNTSLQDDIQLSPGCLYHANDESCVQTFEHMISKSQKEVLFDIYNKLSKIDVQKSPGPKTLLKVTTQSLDKIVVATKGNYEIIEKHIGLVQQALAVIQTLKAPQYSQLELIVSLEKQVQQNIATSRDSTSVLHQISNLIKCRKERNLPLERLLALLIHIYSLTGTEISFPKQHEDALTEALSVAIFEDHKSLLKHSLEGVSLVTPEDCDDMSKRIMEKLKDIASLRKILVRYNSILKADPAGGVRCVGVGEQLVEDLVSGDKAELPDLRHRTDAVKDILRTGLNMLTSKKVRASKHPMDSPVVIIFMLGGITADMSARLHRAVITSGVDTTVLIGSTRLITAVDCVRDILLMLLDRKWSALYLKDRQSEPSLKNSFPSKLT